MEMDKSGDLAEGILPMKVLLQGSLCFSRERLLASSDAAFAVFMVNKGLVAGGLM
jgi:hypothetical protein